MPDAILALNAGSSSIKFGLFDIADPERPRLVSKGVLEDSEAKPHFVAKDATGATLVEEDLESAGSHEELLRHLLEWVDGHLGAESLKGVGHRVVHGGPDFQRPVLLDPEIIAALDRLTPLAPLHQPKSLEPIRALSSLMPGLPQVACFDTAFHHDLAPLVSRYAIPWRFEADGLRKYGFHGLSYDYISGELGRSVPELAGGRTVVAHLGSGASLCAMRGGRSIDTTMGFSALDGLVMGTRCGSIDPGVVLYLQQALGLSADDVEHLLYKESGLLGVSGLSSDVRALLESSDTRARDALDLFAFSISKHVVAMSHSLGGLDGLIFTGGIGEHVAAVRALVCERLAWLGVRLDEAANREGSDRISCGESSVHVRVMRTDEELVIARAASALLLKG